MKKDEKKDQVDFLIEGKYIDQIYAGTKPNNEELRSISDHNVKKLCDHISEKELNPADHYITNEDKEIWRPRTDIKTIRYFNGYRTDRKTLIVEVKNIDIVKSVENIPDGMKPGTVCFVIKLGQIVESKNFKK